MQSCEFFSTFLFVNFYFKDSEKNTTTKPLPIKREELLII